MYANNLRAVIFVLVVSLLFLACSRQPPEDQAASGNRKESNTSPAEELVARSIAYHDPDRLWRKRPVRLEFTLTMADGSKRSGKILIDHARNLFEAELDRLGHHVYYRVRGREITIKVDGREEIEPEVRRRLSLDREGGLFYRNYYTFLYELPTNLDTPGTRIHPEVEQTAFAGRPALAVAVSYELEAGSDEWHHYFDPETAALIGSRFQREGDSASGEYIIYGGEVRADGLRRPRSSEWRMNSDDRLLGTDIIESLQVENR